MRLVDLSTLGAGIEHPFPIPIGTSRLLEFEMDGEPLALPSRLVRSRLQHVEGTPRFCSGMLFTGEAASDILWGLVASRLIDQLRLSIAE